MSKIYQTLRYEMITRIFAHNLSWAVPNIDHTLIDNLPVNQRLLASTIFWLNSTITYKFSFYLQEVRVVDICDFAVVDTGQVASDCFIVFDTWVGVERNKKSSHCIHVAMLIGIMQKGLSLVYVIHVLYQPLRLSLLKNYWNKYKTRLIHGF